ncbi:MAG: phage major capsid protein [Chloroflexi bacterium]|nr:phage major capsid protein [Chloroflexota bacterium]
MPVPISEAVATTIRRHSREISDNVSANIPVLERLRRKGRSTRIDGGTEILEELDYAENESFAWYAGFERLQVVLSEVLTGAIFSWKQAGVAVAISGLLRMQNRGSERQVDAIAGKIRNASRTMSNKMDEALFSDGTGDNGKQIGGLQLLLSTSPTSGMIGGIDRATEEWWRNYVLDETATKANIVSLCQKVQRNTTRGSDRVDLIAMDDHLYGMLQDGLQAQQRFITENPDNDMTRAGFENMRIGTADAVLAGGVGGNCPASHAYFLNTDFLALRSHRNRDMVPEEAGRPIDIDGDVSWLYWMGALCGSNLRLQGVLDGR